MIYWQLFISFLKIGLFSFGGGYAAMPLIQAEVVEKHAWLSMNEFMDLVTISQMTPGPIAINSATFIGIRMAGIPGAIVATFGSVLPSIIIVTIIAVIYMKYRNLTTLQQTLKTLRPAVVAMIASAGVAILTSALWGEQAISIKTTDWLMLVIFIMCLYLLRKTNWNSILIMFLAGIINVICHYIIS